MPLPKRRRVLAAKIEATAGVAESLTASDATYNVWDAIIQPNIEVEDREGQAGFSQLAGVPGAYGGTCTFTTEITGGATAPPWAATFLPACGFVNNGSGVFAPVSKAPGGNGFPKTLTIATYIDGVKKLLRGCMGNAVFRFMSGKRALVDFTFTGIWSDPSDVSILGPTYATLKGLRFANAGLTIASFSPTISQLTIDLGNQVVQREDANDTSGLTYSIIAGRKITGSLDPELVTVATKALHANWLSMTEEALAFNLAGTGQKVAFAAPKLQATNLQEGNRKDITTETLSFKLNRSVAAGDDDLSITFTDNS